LEMEVIESVNIHEDMFSVCVYSYVRVTNSWAVFNTKYFSY
jgi:hypothetical protein